MSSRIRVLLVCVLLGALPGGSARGAGDVLPLDQQVGQLVVLSCRGTVVPAYVQQALRKRHAAGVILFAGNVTSPEQLRALTATLRKAGGRPLVAVDQEGGPVRRVPWVGPTRSELEQVAAGTVRSDAEDAARTLRALWITVTLAPVADVPSVPTSAIASRAFSSDPAIVSASVTAAVRGWRAGGLASAAKHFPGLGSAERNTDAAAVVVRRSRAALEHVDLPPFRAAIRAGVPLVMVGHARYPALDRSHIASQSSAIMQGLLRDELGFRGAVITDSLEARASLSTGSITLSRSVRSESGRTSSCSPGEGRTSPSSTISSSARARIRPFGRGCRRRPAACGA